jgi:membrane protease YdiL (CAAX protease family)
MTKATTTPDGRAAHGVVFVAIMAATFAIPVLRTWPWIWVAPFVGYFVAVGAVPRLRTSLTWLRFGRLTPGAVVAAVGASAGTALVLVGFHRVVRPDVGSFGDALPSPAMGGVILAGLLFATLNAALEEFVFRGVIFDSLRWQWGVVFTLVATSLLFGVGHLRGYPPGVGGACLAVLFGFVTGGLRIWTGGLALPIAVHVVADATIYGLVVRSGAA